MKRINVLGAKSIWLFDINDLNPHGKDIVSTLPHLIKSKYSFEKAPASMAAVDPETKGLKFERGRFQVRESYITVSLEIYNDGLVANSWSSTRDTDLFVEDLLMTAAKEVSLPYSPDIIRAKMHTSELTVRLDFPLSNLNHKLAEFAAKISQACGHSAIPPFETTGVVFGIDLFMSQLKLSEFRIEPRVGFPFSDRRFYSKAPLHTDQHQELLEEFEKLLAAS
jgi:hypothetical protein